MNRSQKGFTVIEMIVVIFIIAIIAGFAAPGMNNLIRSQKVRSISYDLFADLTFARGEAIARGHTVGIVSASGTNWINGWTVVDLGANPQQTLRTQGARSSAISFTADFPGVQFDRTGRVTTGTVSFEIKPVETAPDNQKRCIRIAPSGRPHTAAFKNGVCPP